MGNEMHLMSHSNVKLLMENGFDFDIFYDQIVLDLFL